MVHVDLRLLLYFKDDYDFGNGRDYGRDGNFNVESVQKKGINNILTSLLWILLEYTPKVQTTR